MILRSFLIVSSLVVFFAARSSVRAQCPRQYGCECGTNLLPGKSGKMSVVCRRGGMSTLPLNDMPQSTVIIVVEAPPDRPNTFPRFSFKATRLRALEELHVSGSTRLRSIGEDSFFELSSTLRFLNLSYNAIEYLTENNFRQLSILSELHLDGNQIDALNSATFNMLSGLRILSLRENHIAELPPAFSVGLRSLVDLDLSGNPIGSSQLPAIRGTIPGTVFNSTLQLRRLRLANTSLERLPFDELAKHITRLQHLDVSGNKLCSLRDGQVNRFRQLESVNLAAMAAKCGGRFRIGAGALRGLRSLREVRVDDNDLVALAGILDGVGAVSTLSARNNKLERLAAADFGASASALRRVELGGNPLRLSDRMFRILPSLEALSLSGMQLQDDRVPEKLFDYTNAIRSLNLSANALTRLDEKHLRMLPHLEILDLSSNRLSQVPKQLDTAARNVRELYLQNNRLTGFPNDELLAMRNIGQLRRLRLDANAWRCDCHVTELFDWLRTRQGREIICQNGGAGPSPRRQRRQARSPFSLSSTVEPIVYRRNGDGGDDDSCPRCAAPGSLRNRPIDRLDTSIFQKCRAADGKFIDPDTEPRSALLNVLVIIVGAILLLTLVSVLAVCWHRNRLHSYRTNEEKRRDYDAAIYRDSSTLDSSTLRPESSGAATSASSPLGRQEPLLLAEANGRRGSTTDV